MFIYDKLTKNNKTRVLGKKSLKNSCFCLTNKLKKMHITSKKKKMQWKQKLRIFFVKSIKNFTSNMVTKTKKKSKIKNQKSEGNKKNYKLKNYNIIFKCNAWSP